MLDLDLKVSNVQFKNKDSQKKELLHQTRLLYCMSMGCGSGGSGDCHKTVN